MKRFNVYRTAVALALGLCLIASPTFALAASMSAKADKASVQVGDTVEVTITVSGSGMSVAEGIYTYDPAVLAYAESEGGASDGFLNLVSAEKGGASTLAARIRFTAVGAGEAKIEASIEKVTGYDGAAQDGAKASVSVSVAAPAPTPAPKPLDYSANGVQAQNVQGASEAMYIWRTLENVTIPSRYSETTLDYHGETVAAARVEDSDAPTLLYLSNIAGDSGSYYIYNMAADTLYPYRTVNSVSKAYILLEPDGSVALPEGFSETTLMIGEKEYPAWRSQDAQGELYLLYARNPDGETGYYLYSAADEALQRYAVMPSRPAQAGLPEELELYTPVPELPSASPAPTPAADGEVSLSRPLFFALCGMLLLLILVIAGLLISQAIEKKRRRERATQRRAARAQAQRDEEER